MEPNELRQLANEYLTPFFSGAEIQTDAVESNPRQNCVASVDPCTIAFKVNEPDSHRLHLRRSQPFTKQNVGVLTEQNVVTAFVEVVRRIEPGLDQPYRADLLTGLERRVVGKSIADAQFEPVLLQTLDQLAIWSSSLYEGHPVTSAVGFVPDDNTQSVLLVDSWKRDFSAVMTNGHDTVLTANRGGNVLGHEALTMPAEVPPYAPYRLAPLADWAQNGRVILVLNQLGEILILSDQKLIFARRSGTWHFLTPEAVVTQLGRPANPSLRRAVFETGLDVSFGRSGGCIGVVTSNHQKSWKTVVVHQDDYLTPANSVKARVLSRAIAGQTFQQLDRRLRQEIVAIDGATVIDHHGNLLAIGAILQIPGGSEGGGRLAAAKALSTQGVGIKISQDGGIRCYHDNNNIPVVSVM